MYPSRLKRLEGFIYVGKIPYSLTVCTNWRRRAFHDKAFARDAIDKLLRTAAKFAFAVYAYCVMPDHVHFVVLGERDDSALEPFMHSWSTQTGYAWLRRHSGTLWQGGYHDQILRSDVSIYFAAQYVVMNPVRAGIVTDPAAYEFSGSTVCSVSELMQR
jgi:putative transposase